VAELVCTVTWSVLLSVHEDGKLKLTGTIFHPSGKMEYNFKCEIKGTRSLITISSVV